MLGSMKSSIQGYPSMGQASYTNEAMNGSGYLPPFLIGSPAASRSPQSGFSGTYNHAGARSAVGLMPHALHQQQQHPSYHLPHSTPHHTTATVDNPGLISAHKTTADKAGPPVQGLFDTVPKSSTPLTSSSPARRQLNFNGFNSIGKSSYTPAPSEGGGLNMSGLVSSQQHQAQHSSPAQIDPFYTQGDDLVTGSDLYQQCWITVYGFPPSAASYILEQFAQYGTILKHVSCSVGNWMHILYQSKLQATKALSKNGKVFGAGVMVGVQPCIDKSVIEGDHMTVANSLTTAVPNKTLGAMRPLTAAYQATKSRNEVVPSNPNTPQKDSGLVAKAMEYIFGW